MKKVLVHQLAPLFPTRLGSIEWYVSIISDLSRIDDRLVSASWLFFLLNFC